MPEPVVVIARNALAIKDKRVACLASESIIIDGDERAGSQFCSARQRDATFLSDDKFGIRIVKSDRFCERLAELS
jgi:hypothetical protein